MTVFFDKARGRWRYDFQVGGLRYAKECVDEAGVPAASRRAALAIESEARRGARIAPKLPRASDLTFAQVMDALTETWMREKSWPDRKPMVRELVAFFGAATPIRSIDGAKVQDYIAFALQQPLMVWKGGPRKAADAAKFKPHPAGRTRSAARVNRYLPLLRAAFDRAYNTRDPLTRERAIDEVLPVPELAEMKRKARPVPDDVLTSLLERLPPHLVDAVRVTLFFGLRQSEAFGLQIHQVDFNARGLRLQAEAVKNHTDAFLPGSSHAMQVLAQLVNQARERRTTYLITWTPYRDAEKRAKAEWRPIASPKTAWRTAMKAIEKAYGKRWRWHDIRAAFITQVAITSGAVAAQKLARHKNYTTTEGYIEVADPVTRAAAEHAGERPALRAVTGGKS
jgi:integrase